MLEYEPLDQPVKLSINVIICQRVAKRYIYMLKRILAYLLETYNCYYEFIPVKITCLCKFST